VATRSEAEQVAAYLADHHGLAAAAYHAGLPGAVRQAVQAAFLANRLPILVATSAFGLGIDKPDIRAVVHWSLPFDLSSFYQAVGRAARDGRSGLGLLLHGREDRAMRLWQIAGVTPSTADLGVLCAALAAPGRPEATLTETALAEATGLALPMVRAAVGALSRQHVVRRAGAGSWAAVRPPRAGELAWLAAQAEVRRREREHQLACVTRYATAEACRRRTLLAHFGARPGRAPGPCCDRCLPTPTPAVGARRPPPAAPAGPTPDGAEPRVLATIAARDGRLTTRGVAGALNDATLTAPAVRAAVDRLVASGCIAVYHADGRARLALTQRGRAQLAEPSRVAEAPGRYRSRRGRSHPLRAQRRPGGVGGRPGAGLSGPAGRSAGAVFAIRDCPRSRPG
jgi:ATP-dependent DNA helicase RecQ